MPIFEYTCEDCGTAFEKLVRASSQNSNGTGVACPSCGQDHVKKEFSSFAARATGGETAPAQFGGGCGAGMCQTPGMCGRNN